MVTVNNVKFIAVYQPVSPNDMEIDEYRKQLETAISCRKKDEMLLIGGDHNAQIGKQDNTGKERTLGKFGLRANSEAGDEVVEWAKTITCTSWTPILKRITEVRGVIQQQVICTSWIIS